MLNQALAAFVSIIRLSGNKLHTFFLSVLFGTFLSKGGFSIFVINSHFVQAHLVMDMVLKTLIFLLFSLLFGQKSLKLDLHESEIKRNPRLATEMISSL